MKSSDKKEIIFQATVKLIAEKGINNFTLNNICQASGVSKGGFVYHFPSKDDLLIELNKYIVTCADKLIEQKMNTASSYTEAYIQGCLEGYTSNEMRAHSALTNYYSEADFRTNWRSFYGKAKKNLLQENSEEWVYLILLATDGLWMKGSSYPVDQLKKSFSFLLDQVNQAKEID